MGRVNWDWLLLSSLLLLAGCGQKSGTVPVTGTVRYDGQPLAKASVTFLAQASAGRDARGSTDANGVFQLSTFDVNDGALPGKYKVIVQAPLEVESSTVAATPDEAQQALSEGVKAKPSAIVLPPQYSQPDQTILEQDVPPQGEIVLDLKKDP